jgi:lysophospholipase L1-like esterase
MHNAYPRAHAQLQRIGRSGFDTVLGAFDAQAVVAYRPDLVFVEFAVNDHAASIKPFIAPALRGMVAQIRAAVPACEFVFVYHGRVIDGERADRAHLAMHEAVAGALAIPSIDVDELSAQLVARGGAIYIGDSDEALTTDGTHPAAAAERLIGIPFADALLRILASEREPPVPVPAAPHAPPFDGETFCRLIMERHQLPHMGLFNGIVATAGLAHETSGASDALFRRARRFAPHAFAVSGEWGIGEVKRVVPSMHYGAELLIAREAGATLRLPGCTRFACCMGFANGAPLDVRIDRAPAAVTPVPIVSALGQSVWPLLVANGLSDAGHTIEIVANGPMLAFSDIYCIAKE